MAGAPIVAGVLWCLNAAASAGVVSSPTIIFAGADTNGNVVRLFDASGSAAFNFMPYPAGYTGGVRVAVGDINGDARPDMIVAPGDGAMASTNVKVFDGVTGAEIRSFLAYGPTFLGGVHVAAGDVNGDGRADIITGAGPGTGTSGHVKVFDGRTGAEIRSFLAFPGFNGGVTVAGGDLTGDGRADIIVGAATASPAHVKVFDGVSSAELRSFFAYPTSFTGGVFVAGGDINGDGRDDIITGTGEAAGSAPHVKVFSGADNSELASFFAYTPSFAGGVRVASADINGDGRPDLVTAPGSGNPPTVQRFIGPGLTPGGSFNAFDPTYTGGVFVGSLLKGSVVFADSFED